MSWLEGMRMLKEVGLAAGSFALCAWMVVYLVKRMGISIERQTAAIDRLISKQDLFMDRVKKEHLDQIEDHKEFAIQNKEITATLGRINGYKKEGD